MEQTCAWLSLIVFAVRVLREGVCVCGGGWVSKCVCVSAKKGKKGLGQGVYLLHILILRLFSLTYVVCRQLPFMGL